MSPMIERIAQGVRHGSRPGQEFIVGKFVPSDIAFRNAVGAHRTPFVMVALEPDLEEIFEAAIFGDILGKKVAMVIDDRLSGGILMIEATADVVREKKI